MVVKSKKLKKRSLYVYLPSVKMSKDWKASAEKQKTSISKFVIEHVLNSLKQEDDQLSPTRVELVKQLRERDEEAKNLRREIKLFKQLADKLDTELKRYRAQPFLEEEFQGVRSYDRELIKVLRSRASIDSDRILEELSIDPKESDLVKGVRRQLDNLESYGLIEANPRGWRWVG